MGAGPARPQASSTETLLQPRLGLVVISVVLVALPVFLQAPWVRFAPASSVLFTAVLLAIGLGLERRSEPRLRHLGLLLVGFSGSWLAGSLFWGWARLHPLWHLPIEAFALPLALAGLGSRWRLACGFYLGSLIGTASTDAAIAATGLMPLWPEALAAPGGEAMLVLHAAGLQVLQPACLALVAGFAALLLAASRWLWQRGELGQVVGATLITTLAVDGLFLLLALLAPGLTGLI
ncbi:DUF3120 domain-containing protein [Cyanobium sp. NS01]|uniref:DUF3120 domain-containing protein n=1 Tax=unclassified Cyanobium TaxID=2627006 RepID=UPI00186053B0|nr:DUF3120 domain-containing protein [Cyanobium sp. NS01]QNI69605.1 uncharacterized membrane protein (DUF3120) [Cyanobium sp. NS01]